MTFTIRPAGRDDLDALAELLLADAEDRHAADPGLWHLDREARDKARSAVAAAMTDERPPFRQHWLIAEAGGRAVGVAHSILLPVPPIYAGEFGPPGLIMEDSFVAPDAPAGVRHALLEAAEADLTGAGARILLGSSVAGGAWEGHLADQGYEPLTLYFARTGLSRDAEGAGVRPARAADVPGIVAASAVHRRILHALHPRFWAPHEAADSRFGAWMTRSLTLADRDMVVSEDGGRLRGYAISQPATPLHFPPPHDISGVGMIDDFFHEATEDPLRLGPAGSEAAALLAAAEAARERRGAHSVLVVCPAAWHSKIALLERQGYRKAITWHIRMAG
ncbi:hypothetical protein [Celeribacter indicus]|uniref:Acetyltransferase n=1 Tax=Celeribacter indicus TaxID=1208324 RepID=A0A0B5DTT4_9RHOB|nr:hypothetical protein [Celeribacter indicus]AJE46843.1 acetyltransferase [Celeribacter indicus]SDW80511.1 hypothetical protein SAMN05443573_107132 [Celeribacter indicus]